MTNFWWASLLLRFGLAVVFLYAAIAAFLEPNNWVGYLPVFLKKILPTNVLLGGFSIYEVFLAVWLLLGKKIFYVALLSALTLAAIIVFNIGVIDIVFRDFAILSAAFALAILSYQEIYEKK